jgi:hypothetical protein
MSSPNMMMMATTDIVRRSRDQEWTARGGRGMLGEQVEVRMTSGESGAGNRERTGKETLTMGERQDKQSGVGRSRSVLSEWALPLIHIQMTSKVGWNGLCSTLLRIRSVVGSARFLINYSDLLKIAI